MSGELRLGQFRYTTTPDDDFVIGSPLTTAANSTKYLIFQTTQNTGYGTNPHLRCEYDSGTSEWEILFSNDGTTVSSFVYTDYNNILLGANTFQGIATFQNTVTTSGTVNATGPVNLSNSVNMTGTVSISNAVPNIKLSGTPIFTGTIIPANTYTNQLATCQYVIDEINSVTGAASGLAPLGADSKISTAFLPASVLGGLDYQGTWNAATNTPNITSAGGANPSTTANKGWYYKVSVANAALTIDGNTGWRVGDWIVSNGTVWDRIDNNENITSVNGYTGAVVLATSDIAESSNLYFTQPRVLSTPLTGLTTATGGLLTAADTVATAFGKVQNQISSISLTPGPPSNLAIGTVTTGDPGTSAAAVISGVTPNYTLSFTIPQGPVGNTGPIGLTGGQGIQGVPGPTGPAPTVTATATAGVDAAVTVTNPTDGTYNLAFTLPQGPTGATGLTGAQGLPGPAQIDATNNFALAWYDSVNGHEYTLRLINGILTVFY